MSPAAGAPPKKPGKSRAGGKKKAPTSRGAPRVDVLAQIRVLKRLYPGARTALDYQTPFQLLVATILSAQCTDERVNMVTPGLFRRFRGPRDFAEAEAGEVEEAIRSTGFFRSKTKSLQAASRDLVEKFGGEVPRTMEELVTLRGVGRKTANVVLGDAFELSFGIVVDTHVTRLSRRLGLTKQSDPVKIERDLMTKVPKQDWTLFSHLLILHGRAVCQARKPRCGECAVASLCPKLGVPAPIRAGAKPLVPA
jgi:endonuclease-3